MKLVGNKRTQRMKEILKLMSEHRTLKTGQRFTTGDVAWMLGVARSTWLRGVLDEMVGQGWLNCEKEPHRSNVNKCLYSVTEEGKKLIDYEM